MEGRRGEEGRGDWDVGFGWVEACWRFWVIEGLMQL